jgi:hypothetical protein
MHRATRLQIQELKRDDLFARLRARLAEGNRRTIRRPSGIEIGDGSVADLLRGTTGSRNQKDIPGAALARAGKRDLFAIGREVGQCGAERRSGELYGFYSTTCTPLARR